MQFSTKVVSSFKSTYSAKSRLECVIIPVSQSIGKQGLSPLALELDSLMSGLLLSCIASGDVGSQVGQSILIKPNVSDSRDYARIDRIVLVNCGWAATTPSSNGLSNKHFQDAIRSAIRSVMPLNVAQVSFLVDKIAVNGKSDAANAKSIAAITRELHYRFDSLKTTAKSKEQVSRLKKVELLTTDKAKALDFQTGLRAGEALANGCDLAKDLGNLPGNFCTPTYLANQAKQMGKTMGFKVEVLEKKQIQALKMGSFLSVTQGSDQAPKLIVLQYNGAGAKQAPVALVGKGITFDTGGISLKPGAEMDEMKYDMCGAASVLGAFRTAVEMKLKINLVGVIPACENMPNGSATKPGDVFTSMSGQTIEVLNTDAEGRLVLCDALTFVRRFNPSAVVDIATLTGACIIALGHHHSGLFSKDDSLAHELLDAGRQSGDTCWRMPLDEAYQDLLKSNFADMANIGGRAAGSVTAACFLARFAEGYDWAHLDIAGTAWRSGALKGSTARPVPLLMQFLENRAQA